MTSAPCRPPAVPTATAPPGAEMTSALHRPPAVPTATRRLWCCPRAQGGWAQAPPVAPPGPPEGRARPHLSPGRRRSTRGRSWSGGSTTCGVAAGSSDYRTPSRPCRTRGPRCHRSQAQAHARRTRSPDAASRGFCTCADTSWSSRACAPESSAAPAETRAGRYQPGRGWGWELDSSPSGCSGCTCRGATRTPGPGLPHSILAALADSSVDSVSSSTGHGRVGRRRRRAGWCPPRLRRPRWAARGSCKAEGVGPRRWVPGGRVCGSHPL